MIPAHLDPSIPLDIPDDVARRLRTAESNQRSRAKAKNKQIMAANAKAGPVKAIALLRIEKVDPILIGNAQNWTCACHKMPGWPGCYERVDITKPARDPDAPVIGHIIAMGRGGDHVPANVAIMRHECNQAISDQVEKRDIAKTNSLRKKHQGVDRKGNAVERKKSKMKSRPGGMASANRWPPKGSQKIKSRNNLRRKPCG